MPVIRLLLGLSLTTLAGWLALRCVLPDGRRHILEELALAYGLGMGLVGLEHMIFWALHIRQAPVSILLPWVLLVVPVVFMRKRVVDSGRFKRKEKRPSPLEIFLFLGISFEAAFAFFRALVKPIESYDSIAIYAVRAKAFFESGGIPPGFFSSITGAFPNSGHPILLPLTEAWACGLMGEFNDFLVKIIFPIFLIALLIIFYFALREFFERKNSLFFTFLLASIPQFNAFACVGYADFMLTFYFTAAFLYLFRWVKYKKIGYILLSAVFAGLACWTKIEGWALFLALALTLLFSILPGVRGKKTYFAAAIFLAITFSIGFPWISLIKSAHLENEAYQFGSFGAGRFIGSFSHFDRLPRILYEFQKHIFGPKKWNIIWIIFLTLFALNPRGAFKNGMRHVTVLFLLVVAGYAYAYLLMPLGKGVPINIYISTNLSRLYIHFTPLGAYWIARICREKGYIT